jgi:hypothetical protein
MVGQNWTTAITVCKDVSDCRTQRGIIKNEGACAWCVWPNCKQVGDFHTGCGAFSVAYEELESISSAKISTIKNDVNFTQRWQVADCWVVFAINFDGGRLSDAIITHQVIAEKGTASIVAWLRPL